MMDDASKIISHAASQLSKILAENGVSRANEEFAYYLFFNTLKDAFDGEMSPLIERQRIDAAFAASPAGKAENLADAKRSWYKTLMETQGDDE
jgi:hypothetical protein